MLSLRAQQLVLVHTEHGLASIRNSYRTSGVSRLTDITYETYNHWKESKYKDYIGICMKTRDSSLSYGGEET